MKTLKFKSIALVAAGAMAIFACSCGASTDEEKAAKAAAAVAMKDSTVQSLLPSKSLADSASYLLGIQLGSMIKQYGMADNISQLDTKAIIQGIKDFVENKKCEKDPDFPKSFKIDLEQFSEIMNNFISGRRAFSSEKNAKEGPAFLDELCKMEGYQKTASGLVYKIEEEGNVDVKPLVDTITVTLENGETATKVVADTVSCYYKGSFLDGNCFDICKIEVSDDSTATVTSTPARFVLNEVVKGWTEGMQLVGEGGKIKLYVPAELAYGENFYRANATLIFEVELTKVEKADREVVKAKFIAEENEKAQKAKEAAAAAEKEAKKGKK